MKKAGRAVGGTPAKLRLQNVLGRSPSTGSVLNLQRIAADLQRFPETLERTAPLRKKLLSRTSSVPSASFEAVSQLNKTTILRDTGIGGKAGSPAHIIKPSRTPVPIRVVRRSPAKRQTNPLGRVTPPPALHKKKRSIPQLKKPPFLNIEDDNTSELHAIPLESKSIHRRKYSGVSPQAATGLFRSDAGNKSMVILPPNEAILPNTVVRVALKTRTGAIAGKTKPHNQDNFLVINDFNGVKNQRLLGVFDGHGVLGHEVSGFLKLHLANYLDRAMPRAVQTNLQLPVSKEITQILKHSIGAGFYALNQDLIRKTQIDTSFSGSTAIMVLVRGNLLLTANVGDSRAVLGRKHDEEWEAIPLSFDQKPDNPKERERIIACGGRVEPFIDPTNGSYIGPPRVWMQQEQIPGLAMSRSVGDFVAAQLGVTCEPEILQQECTSSDKFLILASDGVWEFMSNKTVRGRQCVELIAQYWEAGDIDGACEAVVREAVTCWKKVSLTQEDDVVDDITILLAFLVH